MAKDIRRLDVQNVKTEKNGAVASTVFFIEIRFNFCYNFGDNMGTTGDFLSRYNAALLALLF